MLCINVRWKTNLCAKVLIFQGANPLFNVGSLSKLLDFTDRKGEDIADPWYTGNFDATYRDLREGCEALLAGLLNR